MAPLAALASAALLIATANAHFTLDAPPTIGFSDDDESTGPCGGFTPDFAKNTVTDFHVGGDSVALTLVHPQGTWLFRGVAGESLPDSDGNWTQLFPQVLQTGLGKFCEPTVTAPAAWAGQKGILSVVIDAPDGLLYQCAAVNFVAGAAASANSACTNASGVSASFSSDAKLTPLVSGGDDSSDSSASSTAAAGTASSTASSTASTTAAATASATSAAPTSSATETSAASGLLAANSNRLLMASGLAVLAAAVGMLL